MISSKLVDKEIESKKFIDAVDYMLKKKSFVELIKYLKKND
jgi:hypothetical protein